MVDLVGDFVTRVVDDDEEDVLEDEDDGDGWNEVVDPVKDVEGDDFVEEGLDVVLRLR